MPQENDAAIQKYDETLNNVTTILTDLSETLTNTELAIKVQNLAALASPAVKGIDTPQRTRIPQILLHQNSSNSPRVPAESRPGTLYTSTGDIVGESLSFIPIYTHNIRRKWAEDRIECQSLDGKVGSVYGECRKCPYGQFEKGVTPSCSPGANYFILAEDLSAIYRIEFIKSSAPAGKIIRQLALPPNLWSRSFTVTTEKKDGAKNAKYFIYKVAPNAKRTDAETSKVCDVLYEFFFASYKKALLFQETMQDRRAEEEKTKPANGDAGAIDTTAENSDEINFNDAM